MEQLITKGKSVKTALVFVALLLTAACSNEIFRDGRDGSPGEVGPAGPVVVVTPTPTPLTEVQRLVQDENEYRVGLAQSPLTNGLSCVLYSTTGGDRIQASIAGHNTLQGLVNRGTFLMTGTFEQYNDNINAGLNILPTALRAVYKNNYLLRCTGQLVVTETGYYNFELYSDDGSLLYVDGSLLVDNDNAHGITLVSSTKYLRKGVHAFRLDYSQSGAGDMALVLRANGVAVDPQHFVH